MSARDQQISRPDSGLMNAADLDALLLAAGRGDHGAFDLIIRQLSGPIYGLARTLVRDPAQAEEVAQEVLFEMWRTASRYDREKGSAAAWALTIARRRAIDRVRSAAASSAREWRDAAPTVPWDQVSETVQENLDREQLLGCLAALSDRQLQAIVMAFYEGYAYAEIAIVLGVPLGTVKARIRAALTRLRGCMQADPC